jgi:hypothetical protein
MHEKIKQDKNKNECKGATGSLYDGVFDFESSHGNTTKESSTAVAIQSGWKSHAAKKK